jgi:RNA polymerase sigma-70 factor, ECF subfamily
MSEHDSLGDLSVDLDDLARHGKPPPDRLGRTVHRLVQRYCRARLAGLPSGYALADDLAVQVTADLLRDPLRGIGRALPVEAVVYPVMAAAVTRALAEASASDTDRRSPPVCAPQHDAAPPCTPDPRGVDVPTEVAPDVLKELDRLPRRPREVLVLRAFVGLSSEQVARAMGLRVEKVRAEQHRALAHLRSP